MAWCIQASSNVADFKLLLEDCGVVCDIGRKNILFSVEKGYGGLRDDRKCSNTKLMSYGDFTSENILQSIHFNGFVADEAWCDYPLVSEVLGLLGVANHPDDPGIHERTFLARLCPDDFKGKTKLQIEQMLTERKNQELLAVQSKAIRERIAADQEQSSVFHSSIAGLFWEFEEWLWEKKLQEKQQKNMVTKEAKNDDEDEFELY